MYKILPVFLLLFTSACNSDATKKNGAPQVDSVAVTPDVVQHETFERGKVIADIKCNTDNSQSFALYLPSLQNTDTAKEMPVIYFFDSHGDGSFPITKYKSLADEFNFIMIGSNNSKNGNDWEKSSRIWLTLLNDTRQRLKLDYNQISVAGFSGGAKVAAFVAVNSPEVKSAVVNSAAFNDVVNSPNNFNLIALAGTGDMNMTDLVEQNTAMDKTQRNHDLILFDGKHEWAPVLAMRDAFWFIYTNQLKSNKEKPDEKLLDEFIISKKAELKSLLAKSDLLKASEVCHFATMTLTGLSPESHFFLSQNMEIVTTGNKTYELQQQNAAMILQKETQIKQQLMQHFSNPDMTVWYGIINDYSAKSKLKNKESPMYNRLLAFISLACYSLSNRYINATDNKVALAYVNIYKKADPENSEANYFAAILAARDKDAVQTISELKQAIGKGFNDISRMQTQAEFQNMNTQIDFNELIGLIEAHQKR